MRFLKQNTAQRVTVGPFLDVTDAKTPEVALTATNEKITFVVDDAGTPTLVIDTTATASGGSNDLVHISGDDAGYYDLELTATQTNYVGRAVLSVNYVTDHLPVFHEFMIVPANVYDSFFGTDKLQVDAQEWLGQTIATPTVNGVPEVDLTHVAGSTTNVSALATNVDAILTDTGTTLDGAITTIDGVVDAIKAKTDSLTFTVAGNVDANTQYINDAAVTGDGNTTPWAGT